MLKVSIVDNKDVWDQFVTSFSPSNILQSYAWGQFQREFGREVFNIALVDENNQIVAVALTQLIPTKLRSHLYISNGPVYIKEYEKEVFDTLRGYLKALAIQKNVKYVRMDPLIEQSKANEKMMHSFRLVKAPTHTQAERKWILDISKESETLLSEMKKNTRYEIKKAIKDGVTVHSTTDPKEFEIFEKLFLETIKRQKFVAHPIGYYKKQYEVMSKSGNYKLYYAKKDEKVLAVALIGIYGDCAFYLHAASLNSKDVNKYNAPQRLIWGIIEELKNEDIKFFDFWGIAPTDTPKDKWAGFTRFKQGFGGYEFRVLRGFDIPISPIYPILSILESTREIWGGIYSKIKR